MTQEERQKQEQIKKTKDTNRKTIIVIICTWLFMMLPLMMELYYEAESFTPVFLWFILFPAIFLAYFLKR